ncbi:MlaD family protein [Fibrobacter sp. UWB12]|uniref:MlaD family protein n=1 Tax=Fibrobacter sp. UWB12 TaxID=1896203 RepID=UPI0009159AF0|nr:MlaD family protein [Fibrobacter sp. UWB12]SHK84200.1 phospholipid/cholesterol/gamma-HCH transport system substrate-binding protein [Fibrobacter sp. UWB12]
MNSLLIKIKKNFVASLIFIILVVSCGLAAYYFHPSSPYHKRYSFVVKYETIGTLSPGNLVRVRGIAMGEIVDVKLTDEAVYVKARVLADAKIPVNSEFRLVTAGLMGEREMSIITGNSSKLVAEGDTVSGLYDEGTSGITKNLAAVFEDIDNLQQMINSFVDSITVGEIGKRVDRVSKKGKKLIRVTKADVRKWKSSVDSLLDSYHEVAEKMEHSLQELSDRGGESATKANELIDRVRALMDRANVSKESVVALVSKFDESEGSAKLFLEESSKVKEDFDTLMKDFKVLLQDLKKNGLKLNVDIF